MMSNSTNSKRAAVLPFHSPRDQAPDVVRALGVDRLAPDSARPDGDWQGPTLAELAERVEHQFGNAPGLAGIFTLGFGRDEPLTPSDVHEVCEHLGLPAEDFGVGN